MLTIEIHIFLSGFFVGPVILQYQKLETNVANTYNFLQPTSEHLTVSALLGIYMFHPLAAMFTSGPYSCSV